MWPVKDRAELIFLGGWEMDGETVDTIAASGPEVCLAKCRQNAMCRYAVFRQQEKPCVLKKTATAVHRNGTSVLVAANYKTFRAFPNKGLTGEYSRLHQMQPVVEADCRLFCGVHPRATVCLYHVATSGCTSFEFLSSTFNPIENADSTGYIAFVA